MTEKHTPGPWLYQHGAIYSAYGAYLANLRDPFGNYLTEKTDAHGHLMAAAPELCDALADLMHEYVPDDDSEPDPKTRAVIERCRAAIAKSEGK